MASLVTFTGGVKTPLSVLTRGNNNGNRTDTAVTSLSMHKEFPKVYFEFITTPKG